MLDYLLSKDLMLSFDQFSYYDFRVLNGFSDPSIKTWFIKERGIYDAPINLKWTNNYLFVSIMDESKRFKMIKWSSKDSSKRTPSETEYTNSNSEGLKQYIEEDDVELSNDLYDFKVIRTPITCYTYIIGGVNNKAIRMLTFNDIYAVVKPILITYKVKTNLKYDIFSDISEAFKFIPCKQEESTDSLIKFEELFDHVKNKISKDEWVKECMKRKQFTRLIYKQIDHVLKNINSYTPEKYVELVQKEIP